VLGSIILLVCLAALAVAAGIMFVLVGPLPMNRRVTPVSRIQPLPMAAGPIAMPGMPVFDPEQAAFAPTFASGSQPFPTQPPQSLPFASGSQPFPTQPPQSLPFATFDPVADAAQPGAVAAFKPPAAPARKAKPVAPVAPLQLRRPRTAPAPLARGRAARGTEQGARSSIASPPPSTSFDIDHTAPDSPVFEVDELTFVEEVS
jgi:hypothetical protein